MFAIINKYFIKIKQVHLNLFIIKTSVSITANYAQLRYKIVLLVTLLHIVINVVLALFCKVIKRNVLAIVLLTLKVALTHILYMLKKKKIKENLNIYFFKSYLNINKNSNLF